MSKSQFRIALAGNPNCGKTCIFNALTGARQHVGNYPGVTVESKKGYFNVDGKQIELIDLPGVYSLSSGSPEENVVFEELTKPGIDLILNVVDSTIPQRSLYLTTQLAELHIPMLLAFNMSDDAKKKGLKFDYDKLSTYFGSPIVPTVGCYHSGVRDLLTTLGETLNNLENHGVPMLTYGADVDEAIQAVADKIDALKVEKYAHIPARFFAIKLLEHDRAAEALKEFESVHDEVKNQIDHLSQKHAIETDTFMSDRRYAMLAGACRDTISMTQEKRREISDKIDKVMTNKYLGLPIFFGIIFLTFYFTFFVSDPLVGYLASFFDFLSNTVKECWPETTMPYLRSMLTDGVIGGVGGVLLFLPWIVFLFFAIAILEESGYMARAAFVMDGIMRKFGLQGRSFVPLILGFGCTVPAIMATRTIESERDRKVTIMVLPLMSCSARLPIYALLVPAFFAKNQALVMFSMYMIGVVIALIAAQLLKRTLFSGKGEVYLMELPPYRMPTIKSLLLHMWDRAGIYLHKAGTIILASSIILYICNSLPQKVEFSKNYDALVEQVQKDKKLNDAQLKAIANAKVLDQEALDAVKASGTIDQDNLDKMADNKALAPIVKQAQSLNDEVTKLENEKNAELLEYTISGRVGHFMEPFFRPIGFDWKQTTATIGALAAKEVFIAQLGILYATGESEDSLTEQLQKSYTPLQAFSMMVFCLLSIPCLATLAIIKRELNSWKWAIIEAVGLFSLAYVATLIVFQVGSWLDLGTKML